MPLFQQLSSPVMGGAAGFQDEVGCRHASEESFELSSTETMSLEDATTIVGNGNLEHGLCEINGNGRRIHEDSSLVMALRGR